MKESRYKNLLRHYERATRLQECGEYEQSISYYDKVIEIDSTFYGASLGKATALAQIRKFNEALIWIDNALESTKQDPFENQLSLAQKSVILTKLERFDEAFSCIRKAMQINPDNKNVLQTKKFVNREFEKYKFAGSS